MKRLFLSGVIVLSGLALFACDIDDTTEVSYPSEETFYRVRSDVVDFDAEDRETPQTIDSVAALNKYTENYQSIYNLVKGDPSFEDVTTTYDTVFFEDNILVVVPIEENSGAVSHFIDEIYIQNETLNINLLRNVPSIGTTDMAAWHLIVPLDVDADAFKTITLNIKS